MEAASVREPGTKVDVVVYASPDEYAAGGAQIFRTDRGLVIPVIVQKLEELNAAKTGAHWAPVGAFTWVASYDAGFSWQVTEPCPQVGKVLSTPHKCTVLPDGGVVTLGYTVNGEGYAVIQHGSVGHNGYLKNNPPYSHRYEFTDIGPLDSFHGHNIARMNDGTLLGGGAAAYTPTGSSRTRHTAAFLRSTDEGRSWHYLSHIVNNHWFDFCEPDMLAGRDGEVLLLMRVELPAEDQRPPGAPKGYGHFLYQAHSTDGGQTWSEPFQLPLWGHPPKLTRLASGNILLVYAHRREPYSIRAVLSRDDGRTWDQDTLRTLYLWEPGGLDIGYAVGTQLDDGSIVCAYAGYSTDEVDDYEGYATDGIYETFQYPPRGVFVSIFDEEWLING